MSDTSLRTHDELLHWMMVRIGNRGRWICRCGAHGETPADEVDDYLFAHTAECTAPVILPGFDGERMQAGAARPKGWEGHA